MDEVIPILNYENKASLFSGTYCSKACFISNTVQQTGETPQKINAPNLMDFTPEKLRQDTPNF